MAGAGRLADALELPGFAELDGFELEALGGFADARDRADGWLRRAAAVCRAFAEAPCCV